MGQLIRTSTINILVINKMSVRELNKHIKEGRISKAAFRNNDMLIEQIAEVRAQEAEIEIEIKFKEIFG